MKAVRFGRNGPPEVLELRDIGMSVVGGDSVPVRVRAAPVSLLDWHLMVGAPWLLELDRRLGWDPSAVLDLPALVAWPDGEPPSGRCVRDDHPA
jgi:NADPH:quinone reductase-like Zn-dependent oxidoreductase